MMKKKWLSMLVLIATFGVASFGHGVSSWITPQKTITVDGSVESKPLVCYIKETSEYFVSLDKALAKAESDATTSTIFVIPGTNPSISQSHMIVSGDSLILPYTGETYWEGDDNTKGAQTEQDSFKAESTYKKLDVFVSAGVTITNNGTISIGGIQSGGGGGKDKSGQTGGDYAQMTLKNGAKIESYGVFNCYGYLFGSEATSNINFHSGSTTKTLFAIREHRGGKILSSMKDNMKCSPFNRFYIANIRDVTYRFEYGSKMYSIADLYTGDNFLVSAQHNRATVSMIGTADSFLVNLGSGSVFTGKFVSNTYINSVSIFGSFTFTSLALDLTLPIFGTVSLSTGSVLFPLPWYFQVTLNPFENGGASNVLSPSQGVKILPGSSLIINQNVSLNINKLAVYDSFADIAIGAKTTYQSDGHTNAGILTVSGTLTCTASLGGLVGVNSSDALLSLSDNFIVCSELTATGPTYTDTTRTAQGYINSASNLATFDSTSSYDGKGQYWSKSSIVTYGISFTINSNGNANYEDADFEYKITTTYEGNSTTSSITNSNHSTITVKSGTTYTIETVVGAASISSISGTISADVNITIACAQGFRIYTLTATYTDNGDSSDDAETTPQFNVGVSDPSGQNKTISTITTSNTTVKIRSGYYVGITRTTTKGNDETVTITMNGTTEALDTPFIVSGDITMAIKYDGTPKKCLIAGTLITMADGSSKRVEDVHAGDLLRVFNHETGKIETSSVVFNDVEPEKTYVFVNCLFSNGSLVKVQYEHGFFNIEENKYVYIREDNYANYIGKRFVTFDANGNRENLTLTKAYLTTETAKLYSPVTAKTLNYFVEGVLSMPGGVPGLFNIFDVDPLTLKYDEAKKESDIAKYGLLNLADFGGAITQSMFDAFNGQYLGVAVGKGLLTWDDIARMAKRYAPLC
jgi:hypothetical protein